VPTPDLWISSLTPSGPTIAFGLAGNATVSQYTSSGQVWNAVARPRRKPLLEFNADTLQQLVLPLILDASDHEGSVEQAVGVIASWVKPTAATGEPPVLGIVGPVDQQGVTGWVAQSIGWGDRQLRRRDGSRYSQDLTLTLLEQASTTAARPSTLSIQLSALVAILTQAGVPIPGQLAGLVQQLPALLTAGDTTSAAAVSTKIAQFLAGLPNIADQAAIVDAAVPQIVQILGTLAGGRSYVVRDGDSLSRIAARELGDYRQAEVIATMNGLRDWRSISTGQRLQLP
jgi:hypothetical protein